MKNRTTLAALFALAAFGAFELLKPGTAEARPPSQGVAWTNLNGVPLPTLGEDAGINGIHGLLLQGSTNVASAAITAGSPYLVECMPDGGAIHLCLASTDAGCSADPTDVNYGHLVPAGPPGWFFIGKDGVSRIYATGDTATTFTCPVRPMY